jgi:streptogramin lyase
MKQGMTRAVVCLALASGGCGSEPGDEDAELLGEARAEVLLAPTSVKCIEVKVAGTTTVTSNINVSASSSTVFNLRGLPLGSATFTAQAFGVKCPPPAGTLATYVSDPITAVVSASSPVNVSFSMRPANASGSASVGIDFTTPALGKITEYVVPTANAMPDKITAGPDGNVWFTEQSKVGRITPNGVVTEFAVSTGNSPAGITSGPDGHIWFAANNIVGRITTSGTLAEFAVPANLSLARGITAGPDGNVWVTATSDSGTILKITPFGAITTYPLPAPERGPSSIVTGSDGNLWFTESYASKIGRITTSGTLTEFTIPTPNSNPTSITAGPDGHLWIALANGAKVARLTTAGVFTEYAVPAGFAPLAIATGSDGALWATLYHTGRTISDGILRIATNGAMTAFAIPTLGAGPGGIAAGPDGNLWFTEMGKNKVGKISP